MEKEIRLLVGGNEENEEKSTQLVCPLSTITLLSLHKYLTSNSHENKKVIVETVPCTNVNSDDLKLRLNYKADITGSECKTVQVPAGVYYCNETGSSCTVAGLAGISRLLAQGHNSFRKENVHPEGILGFRSSCLQAPNEVSVWTKFCEVELPAAVNYVINNTNKSTVDFHLPGDFARFENHLKQPPRIHNYLKVTQDLKELSKVEQQIESISLSPSKTSPRTTVKKRQWKSKKSSNNANFIENKLEHKFAEGPYLTLADILLYPPYFLLFSHIRKESVISILPETIKWFDSLSNMEEISSINYLLQTVSKDVENVCESAINFTLPEVENYSLYKCDPKRSNPRKRLFTKENDVVEAMKFVDEDLKLEIVECPSPSINWSSIPDAANPFCGYLPDKRQNRKSQQLENLVSAVVKISQKENVIVDFCCGSGHLGILLAYLLPECTIILLENKEHSLNNAKSRVKELGLRNIQFFQCNLDFFESDFDIGVSLHACGVATDLVLEKCLKAKASFVVCPCCYGSVHPTSRLQYPKSSNYSHISTEQYMCIGHAADQTHVDHPLEKRGAECMRIIDSDRGWHAVSQGYSVKLTRLVPLSCSPKNMLLIGVCT